MFTKSSPKAACITCGKSQHLACTYLPRREREGIHDVCQEWRGCGTAQSPSTITRPSRNNPHQVKYPRIQFYKKSQLYTRRHEKMELPPAEKVQCSQRLLGGVQLAQPGSNGVTRDYHAGLARPNITLAA